MYEHASDPIASPDTFVRRLLNSSVLGGAAVAVSLIVGMIGFRVTEGLVWIDAFLNAAMLLGGEGPLEHQRTVSGKLFEGFYAIYCGLAVITIAGIILAPALHRFLHRLHRERR